jgi:hypothetical protein
MQEKAESTTKYEISLKRSQVDDLHVTLIEFLRKMSSNRKVNIIFNMLRQTNQYFPRIRVTKLILTISLSRIKGNMSSLRIIDNNA